MVLNRSSCRRSHVVWYPTRQLETPALQIGIGAEGHEDVVGDPDEQPMQVFVAGLGDAQLGLRSAQVTLPCSIVRRLTVRREMLSD